MDNISDFTKLENENYYSYLWRLDQLINSGKYKNWKEITPMVNKELFDDDESQYRDESAYRKACKYARDFKDAGVFNSDDEYIKELQIQKRELEKERKKLQTEKIEYNRWLREDARDELITEKISEAISSLPKLSSPIRIQPTTNKKSWINGKQVSQAEFEKKTKEIQKTYDSLNDGLDIADAFPEIYKRLMNYACYLDRLDESFWY